MLAVNKLTKGTDFDIRVSVINTENESNVYVSIRLSGESGDKDPLAHKVFNTKDQYAYDKIENYLLTYLHNDPKRHIKRQKLMNWIQGKVLLNGTPKEVPQFDYYYVTLKIRNGEYEYQSKTIQSVPKGLDPEQYLQKNYVSEFYIGEPIEDDNGYYFFGGEVFVELTGFKLLSDSHYKILKQYL